MKKVIIFAVVCFAAMFVSCGNKTDETAAVDSVANDTVLAGAFAPDSTLVEDTLLVDSTVETVCE